MGLVGAFTEVDLRKVYAADRIVIGRFVIDPAIGQIDGRSPLRSARDVRTLPFGMLDADGHIEIVEQVKTLLHGFESGSTLRSRRPIKSRSHEARRRRGVARKTEKSGIAADRTQRDAAQPPGRSVTGIKVHIVVQIGELPLETGGIGEYADFVLVEMRHPADDFQHHLPSGRLSDTPMHDRRGLQSDDPNRSDGRFHLVDGRELRQYPGHELQIGQRAVALRRIVLFIASVLRKEEKSGRQSRFVDSFGDELFLHDGQSHHAVFGCENHAISSGRSKRSQTLTSWDDDILALQDATRPFDSAGLYIAAIRSRKRDAGTSDRLKSAAANRSHTQQYIFCFHNHPIIVTHFYKFHKFYAKLP